MHFPTFFTVVLAVPSISTVTGPKPGHCGGPLSKMRLASGLRIVAMA